VNVDHNALNVLRLASMGTGGRMKGLIAILAGYAFAVAGPGPAMAATAPPPGSGDPTAIRCASPANAFQKAVCTSPELSKAYKAASDGFAKTLGRAPEPWRARLLEGQQSWLGYMARACLPDQLKNMKYGDTAAHCRKGQLAERAEDLSMVFQKVGGRNFVEIVTYRVAPAAKQDLEAGFPRLGLCRNHLIQIMSPANAAEQRWNAMIESRLRHAMAGYCVSADGYAVVDASASDFIQGTINITEVKPLGGLEIDLTEIPWSLRLGRMIKASDLFANPARAAQAMARMEMRIFKRKATKDDPVETTEAQIVKFTGSSKYWSLGEKGIRFGSDDPSDYFSRNSDYLSWAALKPYLRKDIPIDLVTLKSRS
jgi:hypothetical protein